VIGDPVLPPDVAFEAEDPARGRRERGKTRVMLVGSHACFRQALGFLLDRERGLETVAQAETLSDARRLLTEDFDIAVVDSLLPDGSGADLIEDISGLDQGCVAIALVDGPDPDESARATDAGAVEVLEKSVPVSWIFDAVKRLAKGEESPTSRNAGRNV
jgi:two-component system, NarL family, response regulator DevR